MRILIYFLPKHPYVFNEIFEFLNRVEKYRDLFVQEKSEFLESTGQNSNIVQCLDEVLSSLHQTKLYLFNTLNAIFDYLQQQNDNATR